MRTIEINTTQNVTIEYELADTSNRILAFVVDFVIIIVSMFFLNLLASVFSIQGRYFSTFVILPFFLFYSLISEIIADGQSLGKKAIGICVVKINGTKCSPGDYIIRWAFRLVD